MKKLAIMLAGSLLLCSVSCKKETFSNSSAAASSSASSHILLDSTDHAGDVYVINNSRQDNKVVHYVRASNGNLTKEKSYSTGGRGTGFPLGSQGAVCLSDDNNWLFAADPGSNEVSVFKVTETGLELADKVSSRGFNPVSLTQHNNILYVLNSAAGFRGRIAGYKLNASGKLNVIDSSVIDISDEQSNPAQIAFNHDGTSLIITLKKSRQIITYKLNDLSAPGLKFITKSAGIEPFGFAVDDKDNFYVSEAFNGAEGLSSVSSYNLASTANVSAIDVLVQNYQTASCWVAITHDYRFVYASNTGSSTVSGYSITNGRLSLLNSDGISALSGLTPIDADVTHDSKFLYVLNADDKNIRAFSVDPVSGALTMVGDYGELLHNAGGLAVK